MQPQVELHNISKRFGGVTALQNVSLKLHAGQIHCLAGENGSGKSTLIKILAGVYRPDQGSIRIGGAEAAQLTPISSVRQGIQIIYQDFSLFPNLTVLENLSLNSLLENRIRFVSRSRMLKTAKLSIERLGVKLPLDTIAGQLSTAQQQLVAIARALVQEAKLIVLDEPTTALTHIEVEQLFEILQKLKQNGTAILFVSHKLHEMFNISDHFTILRNGEVVTSGAANEFSTHNIVAAMTSESLSAQTCVHSSTSTVQKVLQAENLTSSMLKDITLDLHAGEIVGLTGLLGSGQTDLALALFGLQPCNSGKITIEGFSHPICNVKDAIEAGIAYVPENRLTEGLFLNQSIEHNLIAAYMTPIQSPTRLISAGRLASHTKHWLDEVDVQTQNTRVPVNTLSGGNQQRILLAKWLSRNPKILILNGPTMGVDIGSKEKLHNKFQQLTAQGMAILMISDDLPELAQNCDRVHIIHQGKLIREFSQAELSEVAITEYLNELE